MTRYLITPSLYSSWFYYKTSEDDSKLEFLKTLRKEKIQPNEKMMKGIELELDVQALATGTKPNSTDQEWLDCCRWMADKVRMGLWQEKVYKETMIGSFQVLLYGKADFVRRNKVYDIKYSESYEVGKYQDSIQHDLYMMCSNLPYFEYLITDGRNKYQEDYARSEKSDHIMLGNIHEMLMNITSNAEFAEAFNANWASKPSTPA